MNWLVEQCIRNEGYWATASLVSTCIFLFDERSWRGLAKSGYKFELQRYRTRVIMLAIACALLTLTAALTQGLSGRLIVTAGAAFVCHLFQKLSYDFGGINMSGASKRVLLGLKLVLIATAMISSMNATFIPLMFVAVGAITSLSSRNHLFFSLSQETNVLRQRLLSEQANRHNRHLFASSTFIDHSSDDIAPKAG